LSTSFLPLALLALARLFGRKPTARMVVLPSFTGGRIIVLVPSSSSDVLLLSQHPSAPQFPNRNQLVLLASASETISNGLPYSFVLWDEV